MEAFFPATAGDGGGVRVAGIQSEDWFPLSALHLEEISPMSRFSIWSSHIPVSEHVVDK